MDVEIHHKCEQSFSLGSAHYQVLGEELDTGATGHLYGSTVGVNGVVMKVNNCIRLIHHNEVSTWNMSKWAITNSVHRCI